jgi:hypothetical protein
MGTSPPELQRPEKTKAYIRKGGCGAHGLADSSWSPKSFIRDATGLIEQLSAFDSLAIAFSSMGQLFAFNVIIFLPAP